MLGHYGHVRTNDARKIFVSRNRLGIFQVIEANMPGSLRRHGNFVRTHRIAVRIIDRNLNMRVLAGCVEQTDCFMTEHLRLRAVTLCRNISFCNHPFSYANCLAHGFPPVSAFYTRSIPARLLQWTPARQGLAIWLCGAWTCGAQRALSLDKPRVRY